MQKFLRTLALVAVFLLPVTMQAQNAKVSEYDGAASTATYSSIAGTTGATAWTATNQADGYVDVAMPFAMYFGETQVPANSTLRIYDDGSATFESVTGLEESRIAPLHLAAGYTTTANSVYTKSTTQALTVEWRKVVSGSNSYSFQLKLYSNGDIEFCYGPMTINSSISVLVGMMSSDADIYRVGGTNGGSAWDDITRYTSGFTTRTISSNYYPEQGTVYTFTQPACVKPTGITATATAWNTVNVEWTVSSTGNSYQVKYSTDPDFDPSTEGQTVTSTSLTANVTGLTGSTTYYFYVRKMCGSTPSGWSPMATATTLQGCFNANMPSVTSEGVVTWTSPDELVTSYDVLYGPSGFDPATEGTAISNITALTTTIPNLGSNVAYDVYLRTHCNASGLTTEWVGPATFVSPCIGGCTYTLILTDSYGDGWNGNHLDYYANGTLMASYANNDESANGDGRAPDNDTVLLSVCNGDQIQFVYMADGSYATENSTTIINHVGEILVDGYYGGNGSATVYNGVACYVPTCPKPSALAIDDVTGNSVTLSWTENGTATAWQIAYGLFTTEEDYTIVNATTNPFTVSNLGLGLWRFYVRSVCGAGDTSEWYGYAEQNFGYCTPTCSSHDNGGMGGVSFGNDLVVNDQTATTEDTRYQNHSDMVGDMFAGVDAEVNILYMTGYTYGTIIWIDWNNDLDFDDEGEVVYRGQSASTNPTTLTATFAVPVNAPLGDHRMRIAGADSYFDSYVSNTSSNPSACFTASWAVCRDYTVRVVAAPSCFKPNSLAVSGVTSTEATLTWVEAGLSTQWEVKYGPAGFNVAEGEGISMIVNTTPSLVLDYLEMGVSYDAYVRAICNPEGPTEWNGPVSFTTQYISCLAYGEPGTEENHVIGTGTATNNYLPCYNYYNYSLTEQIYTPAEVGGSGIINSIAFYNNGSEKTRNIDVYLLETDKASFSGATDWVAVTEAQKVYTGSTTFAVGAWTVLTLSTHFNYSGSGNLLVVVDDNTGSYASSPHAAFLVSDATAQALRIYSDGTNYDPINNPSYSGNVMNVKNNIQLGIQYAQCISTPVYAPQVAITLSDAEYAATLAFTNMNEDVTNPTYGIIWGPQGFNPATSGTTVSPISADTYTISNLTQTTTYDVYVYAISSNGNSDTVRYSFTTPFIPNCKTPNTIAASNITYNTANLTWNQPGDVPQTWTVRYATADFDPATAAATDYTELTITGSNTPAAQLTGLVAGTTYYVYIKSTCSTSPVDESPWSQMSIANPAYTFTTPVCVTPTAVAASDVTNSTAMISWTEAGNATAWTVKYGPYGFDPDNEGIAVAVTVDSLELTGLDAYVYYDVYVKSNCTTTDESDWSSPATFRTACPDGGDVEVVGNTAETQYTIPVNTYFNYSYTQQIITAEEIPGAGAIQGISLSYAHTAALDPTKYDVTIYIGTTDKASFASSSDFVDPATLTAVWHGTFNVEQGWNNFIFDTPFMYDGSSNIVVAFDDDVTGYNSSSHKFNTMTTSSPMALAYYSDSYNPDPTSSTTLSAYAGTKSTYSYRNVMKLMANCNTDVTCFAPASISASVSTANVVTLNWAPRTDLRPVVNNYQVKYGLEGFNPDNQGTLIDNLNNVTTTTINGGLAYNQNYDVYVRTVCGGGDYSSWTKGTFVTYPSCWAPVDLTVTGTTSNSATLTWANDSIAPTAGNRWEVSYGLAGFGDPEYRGTKVETTNNTAFEVTGLNHSTKYDFYVRAICNATDHSDWSLVATGTTQCGVWQYADMPLVENFDGVTGTTSSTINNHVLPNCWDYINTSTTTSGTSTTGYPGYPIAYNSASNSHSGNNHMRFYTYTTAAYGDQYAILPQFGFDLDTVVVGFYACESSTSTTYVGKIVVGVMSDPDDASTFVAVDTVLPTTTSYEYFEVNMENYEGTGRYIALKAVKPTTGYNIVYLDDLTVKLREKVNSLPDNGGTIIACNEFVMPDTTNGGSYHGNLNATYVVRPAQAGYVARIQGDYDLENGYDFLNVYRGAVNANNLVGRYTGTGSIDYMTTSNLWADSGYVTLVLTSDVDNAFDNTGFKFLVSCEQPFANPTPIEDVVEANGTYTWELGNGQTYTNHSTMEAAPDRTEDIVFPVVNVAGFDSVYRHLTLTVHPTYELAYSHVMCERDEYEFYGQTYTATGNYTVTLQSQYGADSVGVLALQVNPAPTAFIQYNNRTVTTVADMCDNFDMTLNARSNIEGVTFLWEDSSTAALRVVNPHESNTYSVIAINPATGCTSLPASVTVTTTPVPALTISGDSAICYGQSATLTLADANNVPATYRWSNNATTASITVNPTTTTTYSVTATSTTGACIATAEFTVTVNALPVVEVAAAPAVICQNDMINLTATNVEGYSYSWSTGATTREATVAAAATGNYTVTVTDQNGCVNEFTTNNVTVNPVYELNDEQSACVGMLPYTWGTQTLSEAGSYDQTFQTINSCDSTVHLTFIVQDTANNNSYRELCEGATFTFGTGIYQQSYTAAESTVISYVDTTSGECPARYNLNLTVNTHNPAMVENTVCDSYTWPLNNETYTTSGAYQTMLQTTKGCDSLVTLNLTVNYQNTGVQIDTVCDTYTWNLNGETYTASTNEPTFTLQNEFGCDSVVTLNLTVNYKSYHEDFHCVRDAASFIWDDNETYNLNVAIEDSIEWVSGENAYGCQEIALLHLVLNPVIDILNWTNVEACDEYEIANAVVFNDADDCEGHTESLFLRDNGDYEVRTRTASGNDQLTRIHLTVTPSTYHTTMAEACLPYTWKVRKFDSADSLEVATITEEMVNGANPFNMSVDMAEAGYVASGCANIEVLRLTPKYPTTVVTDTVTICENGSWTATNNIVFNGADYSSGIYKWDDSELNAAGCPLTKQVNLTVNPVYTETMEITSICESQFTFNSDDSKYVYTLNDENHNGQSVELTYENALNGTPLANQTATASWITVNGCDSTVNITFTVNPVTTETTTEQALTQYVWAENGQRYEGLGEHIDTVIATNDYGCTLYKVLNLTITDTIRHYIDTNVCTSYEVDGVTYVEDKTFVEIDKNTNEVTYTTYHVMQRTFNEVNVVSNVPYTWINGETYTANVSNVYYGVPAANPGECEDVYKLTFTMVPEIVICEGQVPYNTGYGFTIDTTVSDVWNNNDANGNDTIIAYTVKLNVATPLTETACDTYTWNDSILGNTTYTESGEYTKTYTAANDCDSVVTLTLTINASTASTTTDTACDSYTWNNTDYTTSGTYTFDAVNANGCDSTATLNLVINKNNGVEETVAACVTYNWKGTDYTTSGTYSVSFTDVNGCVGDSVLYLTINQPVSVEETVVVNADSASYRFNGVLYTAPYDYTVDGDIVVDTVSVVTGCDSTYTLHLVIPFVGIDTIHVNGCGTYTWDMNNITYGWIPMSERQSHGMALFKDLTNNKYVYTYPVDTLFGTDGEMKKISMLVLNMMEAEYTTATLNLPLSLGTWTIEGIDAAHNKTYNFANETVVDTQFFSRDTVMLASTGYCANYCDYTVNLVNNYTVTYVTVCDNEATYTWHGEQILGTPGHTFAFEYVENAGTLDETVDSIYIYQLPVNNLAVDTKVACDGIEWNGTWYFASNNTATFQTTTARGCDSTVTLNLTINASTHDAFTVENCDTYTWSNNGSELTYTESGDYMNSYTNAAGCASTDTLHLTIKNNSNQGYTAVECNSYTWERNGQTYTTSGDKTYEYNAVNGCPSVDTLHLTINMPTHTAYTETACDSMTWHGTTYYVSGDYNYDYNTEAGCASTDTLHLTINAATHNSETLTQCDSYEWHGTTYTASGDYTYEYTNVATCPSVDTLHLTINVNTTGVEVYDTACDEYTWVLNNNRLYTTSGDYYCTTTDTNGCTDTNTLHLTINSTSSYDSTLYISDGSYQYTAQNGNVTFYGPGVYNIAETYTNVAGCDSTLNITLNVGTVLLEVESYTSCSQYTWRNGKTYTWLSSDERAAHQNDDGQPAIYYNSTDNEYVYYMPTYTVPQENNYDSVYMLSLTLTQSTNTTDTVNFPISLEMLHYGDSIFDYSALNSRDFVNTTEYREVHFHNDYYCDSIVDLTVNLVNNYVEAEVADICVTQTSYTWRGHTIDVTPYDDNHNLDYDHAHTYYVYDIVGTAEAPVIEYVKVNQHPVVYATERRTACDSYEWNGTVYTESTTNATYSTVDQYGCDSTVTLMLTIKKSTSSELTAAACETYTWSGITFTESADTTITGLTNAVGCDSTATLHLTVNHKTSTAYTVDACDSYTWENGSGLTYTTADTFFYTYDDAAGICTSVDTLYLTLRKNSNTTYTKTVCDTYTWTAAEGGNDETYTVSGTYTYDYEAENGCPSTNTLVLTVNQNSGHKDVELACDSIAWHGNKYYVSGTYTYDYADGNNCPSIDTLELTVNQATHNSDTVVACDSYTWHGTAYTTSGVKTYSYDNGNCASVDTLHLTINNSDYDGVNYATMTVSDYCGDYTWVVNDSVVGVYTESVETSTRFTSTLTACDSIIFLNLTIKNAPVVDTTATVCENTLPYVWRGIEMNEAGVETVAFPLENGCDSTIRFTLNVNPKFETLLNAEVCLGSGYTGYNFDIDATELPEVGDYTFEKSFASEYGCDSIVKLTIKVKTFFSTTVEATACDSYIWDLNGQTYNESGNYDHTLPAVNGCDSVITLALTINGSTTGIDVQNACNRYTWIDGNTYTASNNTATFTLDGANANGCDSVVTLNLTVNYSNNYEFDDVACNSYTWNGATYNQSGNYTYAGTNVDGCDSVVTLHLTINNSTTAAVEATACDSYEWTDGDGQTYTESGDYTYTTTAANGCDSVVTLTLTINTPVNTTEDVAACESYDWNGETYTTSGTYTYDFVDANNCAAVATLNLTINSASTAVDVQTACDSYTWIDGVTYTESENQATFTLTNAAGCDSVVTLDLTVNASTSSNEVVATCGSYDWNGQTYNQTGSYTFNTTNAAGCDSIATLTLVINQSVTNTETATACDNYEWNGQTYTESGAYLDTLQTTNGCDSVVTLLLTIKNSTNNAETVASCDSYTWNNTEYAQSGDYTFSYTNAAGCASTDTLHLTINASTEETVNATACDSYTWSTGNGQTYTTSGNYTYNTTNANGCDHVVTLALTINNASTSTQNVAVCGGYTWNGQTYAQSGVYTYQTTNAAGCDSVATLILSINQPFATTVNQTACDSYEWNGQTYTTSGNYTYNYTASNNCDSVVTLALTINQSKTNSFNADVCAGSEYTWNNQTYTTAGQYEQTLTARNGCDSVVTMNLTVLQPVNTTESETACVSYTWTNGQTYTQSGTYTANITDVNGCAATATLNLIVNQPINTVETVVNCVNYEWNGQTYTESGTYTNNITDANGCAATATLNLTINPATSEVMTVAACDSYTWVVNDSVIGVYTETPGYQLATPTINENGCPHTVYLLLTINNSVSVDTAMTVIGSYTWHGETYTESGTYTYTSTGSNGCDSTTILSLTVQPAITYYTVTLTSANPGMGTVSDGGEVAENTLFTAVATANDGYHFVAWVDGNGNTVSELETYQFVVTSDVNLTAQFAFTPIFFDVTAQVVTVMQNGDTVIGEHGQVLGAGEFESGSTVTLTAVADSGYHFVCWSNGRNTATITFTVTDDIELIAYFEQDQQTPPQAIDETDMSDVVIFSVDTRIIVRGVENNDVYVFDVNGRMLDHKLNVNGEVEFRVATTGVYLVKVGNAPAKRVLVVR